MTNPAPRIPADSGYAIPPALMDEIRRLCTDKGWRTPQSGSREGHEFAAYIALAHAELSEALDAYRDKIWSARREDGKPIGVGPELADALIRILDMADIWHVDISYEIGRVLDFGWTRPYLHGGRVL